VVVGLLVGAVITGLGYALVYPSFGVEAVRAALPESRRLAMGAYTTWLDLALGVAGPVLGLVANWQGLSSVFLVSGPVVLCAAIVALRTPRTPPTGRPVSHSPRKERTDEASCTCVVVLRPGRRIPRPCARDRRSTEYGRHSPHPG